jgi:hypothetical protein
MRCWDLVVADRRYHERVCPPNSSQHEAEQVDRCLIRPMQVIDDKHRRLCREFGKDSAKISYG